MSDATQDCIWCQETVPLAEPWCPSCGHNPGIRLACDCPQCQPEMSPDFPPDFDERVSTMTDRVLADMRATAPENYPVQLAYATALGLAVLRDVMEEFGVDYYKLITQYTCAILRVALEAGKPYDTDTDTA